MNLGDATIEIKLKDGTIKKFKGAVTLSPDQIDTALAGTDKTFVASYDVKTKMPMLKPGELGFSIGYNKPFDMEIPSRDEYAWDVPAIFIFQGAPTYTFKRRYFQKKRSLESRVRRQYPGLSRKLSGQLARALRLRGIR